MIRSVELPAGTVRLEDTGSGEPIVFLHGLLMSRTVWRDVTVTLSAGARCIAPDLPFGGHEVALGPDADTSPPGVARMVVDLLDALELPTATIVGHDTGGAIAQIVAARYPDRVSRLVLTNCDAYESFLPPMFRYLQWAARVPGAAEAVLASMRVKRLRRTPIAFGWLAKRLDDERLDAWIRSALADAGVRRDVLGLLRGIDPRQTIDAAAALARDERPTLIAWAPEDRIFRWRFGARLADAIPGARLERIDDSLTLVPVDQPVRLATLIAAFVAGTTAAARSGAAPAPDH
jgi:pimeloyl-ACP methyl ester carboxylesterase